MSCMFKKDNGFLKKVDTLYIKLVNDRYSAVNMEDRRLIQHVTKHLFNQALSYFSENQYDAILRYLSFNYNVDIVVVNKKRSMLWDSII